MHIELILSSECDVQKYTLCHFGGMQLLYPTNAISTPILQIAPFLYLSFSFLSLLIFLGFLSLETLLHLHLIVFVNMPHLLRIPDL